MIELQVKELQKQQPVCLEYRGNVKDFVGVFLDWINRGVLLCNGVANCEKTFRTLADIIVVKNEKGKNISTETLISYEKKMRAGEWDLSRGGRNEAGGIRRKKEKKRVNDLS